MSQRLMVILVYAMALAAIAGVVFEAATIFDLSQFYDE